MWKSFLFLLNFLILHCQKSKALECGLGRTANVEELKHTLSRCVRNNETMTKILEMATSSVGGGSEESHTTTLKPNQSKNNDTKSTTKDLRLGRRLGRTKRFKPITHTDYGGFNLNERRFQLDDLNSTNSNSTSAENSTEVAGNGTQFGENENCVLHCILNELQMVDEDGFLDHNKFTDNLLKTAQGRELRDFLQDSADECFQDVDKNFVEDPCQYSTKIVMCLAEKGKRNCSDWPVGNLPF